MNNLTRIAIKPNLPPAFYRYSVPDKGGWEPLVLKPGAQAVIYGEMETEEGQSFLIVVWDDDPTGETFCQVRVEHVDVLSVLDLGHIKLRTPALVA